MLYQPRNYDSVSKGPLVLKKIKDVSESLIVRRNSDERTRFHRSESQKSESVSDQKYHHLVQTPPATEKIKCASKSSQIKTQKQGASNVYTNSENTNSW